jgi:hypothetical protein
LDQPGRRLVAIGSDAKGVEHRLCHRAGT